MLKKLNAFFEKVKKIRFKPKKLNIKPIGISMSYRLTIIF